MKRLLLASARPTFAAPSAAEQAVLDRSAAFDQAIASGQPDRVRPFLHEKYSYVEPLKDATAPSPKAARTLAQQLADRLRREVNVSLDSRQITLIDQTAIVTGNYQVIERPAPGAAPPPSFPVSSCAASFPKRGSKLRRTTRGSSSRNTARSTTL